MRPGRPAYDGTARRTRGSWPAEYAARARRRRRTGGPAARCGAAPRASSRRASSSVFRAEPTWPTSVALVGEVLGHALGRRRCRRSPGGARRRRARSRRPRCSGRSWRRTTNVPAPAAAATPSRMSTSHQIRLARVSSTSAVGSADDQTVPPPVRVRHARGSSPSGGQVDVRARRRRPARRRARRWPSWTAAVDCTRSSRSDADHEGRRPSPPSGSSARAPCAARRRGRRRAVGPPPSAPCRAGRGSGAPARRAGR